MSKKCNTCYGYGMWPDGTAPMGPLDASDGMPTITCTECGANAIPSTLKGTSEEEFIKDITK